MGDEALLSVPLLHIFRRAAGVEPEELVEFFPSVQDSPTSHDDDDNDMYFVDTSFARDACVVSGPPQA